MSRIYVDLDGVLADFDTAANAVIGEDHYKFSWQRGDALLWQRLNAVSDFFLSMPMMPDAEHLWRAVEHRDPAILTALPKTNREEVARQKREWVKKHLGPNVSVITCMTRDKPDYATPGAVLIDDRTVNQPDWEAAGGHFIHHLSAMHSILELRSRGLIDANL